MPLPPALTSAPTNSSRPSARGDADATFDWLERAYAQRDAGVAGMKLDPHFRALHGDQRWGVFLARVGFEA